MTLTAPPNPTGPPSKPDMLTGWLICLVFIGITLVVSYFTYRFVEVPARRWINKSGRVISA
ncbi:hypothetical protein [Runella limosa]|uniref:hypothetical protein n=1 Tax=Runella limosa TaxID=370978 RepID=UPI0012F7F4F4|nr:hypothetical protein [Runella limosa]